MPSQIATKRAPAANTAPNAPPPAARAPKRQRGRLRVAAILQAGREVFTEKGYDAATHDRDRGPLGNRDRLALPFFSRRKNPYPTPYWSTT